MKVFISWSGNRSKKVAQIFRDWLPSIIQSIEPFVSSEDIEKGARWNTDIAQELKVSTFGIICVTKDNLSAPWLNFEAGALSKTIDNSFVAPFLFDVKPSELKDSPISQFQATTFTKEDLKRFVTTLNAAAGNCLPVERLNTSFDVWYPSLEKHLNDLRSAPIEEPSETQTTVHPDILEELLEVSRNTQRLLGSTDIKLHTTIEQLQKKLEEIVIKNERLYDSDMRRSSRKLRTMLLEELFFMSKKNDFENIFPYNILIVLSFYREEFPWLYDAGNELIKLIQTNAPRKTKMAARNKFKQLLEFTIEHPIMREMFGNRKEVLYILDMTMPMLSEIDMNID